MMGLLCFIISLSLSAQDDIYHPEVIRPVLLDKSALSGIGLEKVQLKDTPDRDFWQKNLFRGKEISVYVVSSESWTVPFDGFWFDEFIYILQGSARVGTPYGDLHFQSGEYFYAPKGFKGAWEVRAGDHPHYELSVITNKRADPGKKNMYQTPGLLNPHVLSGSHIELNERGLYEDILFKGIELTIKMKVEAPRSISVLEPHKEQLICLLTGQLVMKDSEGATYHFHSGDYIAIPHGFVGSWESQGHGIVKYITVEEST